MFRPSRLAAVLAGCAALTGAVAPAVSAQPVAGEQDPVTLSGSVPSWATTQNQVGQADDGQQRDIKIALALRDPRGAQRLAKAVSTPGSPQHGQYLSAEEFTNRFAATEQTVDRVSAWLRQQGLDVRGVSSNRHFIHATGGTGQLERSFRTNLGRFHHTERGHTLTLTAPESPLSLPRDLAGAVQAVLGLDDSERVVTNAERGASAQPAAPGDPNTCARFWGESNNTAVPQKYPRGRQSNALCGYNTAQTRGMYGLDGRDTGAGTTIAVVGAYNHEATEADTNRAAARFGSPPLRPGQYTADLPDSYEHQDRCAPESWAGEQVLDVQAAHTMAPAANLRYYGGRSCLDLFNTLNRAVSDNAASVISSSWGNPSESSVPAQTRQQFGSIAVQAAVQGQSLVFSSGDTGDSSGVTGGAAEASFPASHPWATAVGGTSVALDADNRVEFTTGWENTGNTQTASGWSPQNDSDGAFAGGAVGGTSKLYNTPDYQKGVVGQDIAGGHRALPDISALADSYTGFAVGFTDANQGWVEYGSGGTSLAAPLLAGMVADAHRVHGGKRLGFLNTALYEMDGAESVADVTPVEAGVWSPAMHGFGAVDVPAEQGSYLVDLDAKPQSLQSGPGWDPVTGVGTPRAGFIDALGS